ncbi:hypothetical protein F9C07_7343 [Aspergillus flavus]|uniref:Uncharacterized protein n=1 Tax=Aspergillus flavus (strain ATCC 200026 / FGSC A1120 / IAM 13836 / NRRL 3357 / JCM 12722 / SRRC 167) TaxID=332952 RepID=A0A7U2MMJ7_ASPFN|nr:hypothetical protein F9C07_7343 [Aspergillus flavus]
MNTPVQSDWAYSYLMYTRAASTYIYLRRPRWHHDTSMEKKKFFYPILTAIQPQRVLKTNVETGKK